VFGVFLIHKPFKKATGKVFLLAFLVEIGTIKYYSQNDHRDDI
jgi:hypothetical protein